MSQHFYGSIWGAGKEVTKGGHKTNGLSGHIRGWNVGARIDVRYNEQTGQDTVTVYATSGSSGAGHDVLIAEFNADTIQKVAKQSSIMPGVFSFGCSERVECRSKENCGASCPYPGIKAAR